jgi:predicted O-methyltransferase YrrM
MTDMPREDRFTGPSDRCPHPEWWHSANGNATEIEASILIAGLIRATQPEFVVETGSWEGQTTELIGRALMENGHGTLDSLEIESSVFQKAKQRCADIPSVNVINIDTFQYTPPKPINFLFIDGAYDREGEARHLFPYMGNRSILVMHDSASLPNQTQVKNIIEMRGGEYINIDIPRGLLIVKLP